MEVHMLKDLFRKRKYATITVTRQDVLSSPKVELKAVEKRQESIDESSVLCKGCESIIDKEALKKNLQVCPVCGFHLRLGALDRLAAIIDEGTFIEYDNSLETLNPLEYFEYEEKIKKAQALSGIKEAVITGEGLINGRKIAVGIMDSNFIMGSMGSVVGEKLVRMIEKATDRRLPVVIFCTSGGARMQEGILTLMQMAKVSAALKRLSDSKILYISMLTDPTTGGVTASYAMLGDIILAEPGAQIGFAGKRVIEQTIRQKLPEGFQTSEFLLSHGFVDMITSRVEMKKTLGQLIALHNKEVENE
jgi:acetyl-CoA carboxylase carboxyl transferase subunit beta